MPVRPPGPDGTGGFPLGFNRFATPLSNLEGPSPQAFGGVDPLKPAKGGRIEKAADFAKTVVTMALIRRDRTLMRTIFMLTIERFQCADHPPLAGFVEAPQEYERTASR